ncbi:MAG: hypothetical protein HY753_09055 [Nitrospirae bacterium]|nr:hypothetical protein [Nitrospirota bacterium]
MYLNLKSATGAILLALPLVMSSGFSGDAHAGEKNPCAMKNPCEAKKDMAKGSKPIRKTTITDKDKLMQMAEKLWADTKLGRSGLSCATCHPADGSGTPLRKEPFPRYIKMADDIVTLDQMINFCMLNPMNGKPIRWNSEKMTALAAYFQAHATEEGEPVNPCAAKNPCGMKNPCGEK